MRSRAKELVKTLCTQRRPRWPGQDRVLLTFDDGPHPSVTPVVLDLLDQYGARAVFFVVGKRIPEAPEMLREIVRRGHALGNHSYGHRTGLDYRARIADMSECQREVSSLAGFRPSLYRPPEGKLDPQTLLGAWRSRMRVMLWSTDTRDWDVHEPDTARANAAAVAGKLLAMPRIAEILLCHDDNPHTPVMLEALLPALRDRGCLLSPFMKS